MNHAAHRTGWILTGILILASTVGCGPLNPPNAALQTPDQIAAHLLLHPPQEELSEWQAWLPESLEAEQRARLLDLLDGMPTFDRVELVGQQELSAPATPRSSTESDASGQELDAKPGDAVSSADSRTSTWAIDLQANQGQDSFGYSMHFVGSTETGWMLVWLQGPEGSWAAPDPVNG